MKIWKRLCNLLLSLAFAFNPHACSAKSYIVSSPLQGDIALKQAKEPEVRSLVAQHHAEHQIYNQRVQDSLGIESGEGESWFDQPYHADLKDPSELIALVTGSRSSGLREFIGLGDTLTRTLLNTSMDLESAVAWGRGVDSLITVGEVISGVAGLGAGLGAVGAGVKAAYRAAQGTTLAKGAASGLYLGKVGTLGYGAFKLHQQAEKVLPESVLQGLHTLEEAALLAGMPASLRMLGSAARAGDARFGNWIKRHSGMGTQPNLEIVVLEAFGIPPASVAHPKIRQDLLNVVGFEGALELKISNKGGPAALMLDGWFAKAQQAELAVQSGATLSWDKAKIATYVRDIPELMGWKPGTYTFKGTVIFSRTLSRKGYINAHHILSPTYRGIYDHEMILWAVPAGFDIVTDLNNLQTLFTPDGN